MEVFLLAAGLGTRLRPLTNDKPKALVNIAGSPLLERNINNLTAQGATKIVINVHHFGEQIINYISSRKWGAEILISDERKQLLDTGGGLKYAVPLFSGEKPIMIYNVDILSKFSLQEFYEKHTASTNIATLAVSRRETSRYLLFDEQQQLKGWHNTKTDEYLWSINPLQNYTSYAFSGIAIINPELLNLLPPASPYPIIPEYLKISKSHSIGKYEHSPEKWIDVGKPETLQKAQLWYKN